MTPDATGKDTPQLAFTLQVDPALQRLATAGDPVNRIVHEGLSRRLNELMQSLGIPGEAAVVINAANASLGHGRLVQLRLDGQLLGYSDELIYLVYCWLNNTSLRAVAPATILAWLIQLSNPDASDSDHETVARFLSEVTSQIVKGQPALLLGERQLVAYLASLPEPATNEPGKWPAEPAWVRPILARTLSLKISIADKQTVADTLAENSDKSWSDACEHLIDVLYPDAVEIHLGEDYLRQLTLLDSTKRVGLFAFLRDGLFVELGMVYPEFRLVPDPNMTSRQFLFKLNSVTLIPLIGLTSDECLVNDTPARLNVPSNPLLTSVGAQILAKEAANPANGQPNSIVGLEYKDVLETHGLTTWDQMGYLILSLAGVLRRNGACFVNNRFTDNQLQQMQRVFPALTKAAQSVFSREQISGVLRNLVAEELSIRNFRLILERLVDYQFRNLPGCHLLLDNGIAAVEASKTSIVEFTRSGMKRQIGNTYSKGSYTVVVYLLDPELERFLADRGNKEEVREKIVAAIREEVAHLPATALIPSILTTQKIRGLLRETIALELPRMSVIAYEELMQGVNIQPVARISLPSHATA